MERLWAPWRMRYVVGSKRPEGRCVFCAAASAEGGGADHVIARGARCYSILNAYPYNNGHLMVVPYEHLADLDQVSPEVLTEMIQTASRWTAILRETMKAEGFNVGLNLGPAAGAGISEHLHLHVVPRWLGDTNFMPSVGGVKVLPEDLETTGARLRAAWEAGLGA